MAKEYKTCSVDGCNGDASKKGAAKGFCVKHYQRFKKHGDPSISLINREQTGKPCLVEGCGRNSGYKGFCNLQYQKTKKLGLA